MKYFLSVSLSLCLLACSVKSSQPGFQSNCESFGYCFDVPKELEKALGENDVSVFSTPPSLAGESYYVQPYHIIKPCSPSLTGASSLMPVSPASEQAEWGRVDAFDRMDEDGNWPEGYESPIELSKIVCKKEGIPRPKEVYSLCSEKNCKTVVICISQIKDDPAMAKQIFETFRWTE